MKTVVIDRSKWRTGDNGPNATGLGNTQLNNDKGFKCCLGFICEASKVKTKYLHRPSNTNRKVPFLNEINNFRERSCYQPQYNNTDLSHAAMGINDKRSTTRQEKEKKLKKLFKGKIDLQFVGRSVKYKEE